MLKHFLFFIVFLFLFSSPVFACLQIKKETNSTKAFVEDSIEVAITIENNCGHQKIVSVIEFFEGEVIYPKDKVVNASIGELIASLPPRLVWKDISIEVNGKNIVKYIFKPMLIGLLTIQPTQVIDENGITYFSNKVKINVDCNHNKICEKKYSENYINCPSDCPSGSDDGICDGIEDGKCDPDCELNADPDCVKGRTVCGNRVCEPPQENQTTCCLDCGCPENLACIENKCLPCGNNKCNVELGENYKLCPKDCPSGSKDDYCDAVTDGRCDPDCREGEDIDCIKPIAPWIYFVIVGVAIGLIILLIVWSKRAPKMY
jgi:hypothetical protein